MVVMRTRIKMKMVMMKMRMKMMVTAQVIWDEKRRGCKKVWRTNWEKKKVADFLRTKPRWKTGNSNKRKNGAYSIAKCWVERGKLRRKMMEKKKKKKRDEGKEMRERKGKPADGDFSTKEGLTLSKNCTFHRFKKKKKKKRNSVWKKKFSWKKFFLFINVEKRIFFSLFEKTKQIGKYKKGKKKTKNDSCRRNMKTKTLNLLLLNFM